MPRCRTYLSSSGTPVHTCCLRFCPRNSSSSSHHGNVSANDDIQEVHHVPVCIPLPSFAKAFFNFSFSRERRNQQQEPHLTPSQPASQPVSPACPAQCRERATSQKQKGREGKGRRLTREDGRPCATRFRKASSHVVVRACMRACAVSLLLFIPGYYCLSAVRAQDGTCISLAKTRASPKKKKQYPRKV